MARWRALDPEGNPVTPWFDTIPEDASQQFIDAQIEKQHEQYEAFKRITVTVEMPAHSISPKLYRILTGRRLPFKTQIAYFAREWPRKAREKFFRWNSSQD